MNNRKTQCIIAAWLLILTLLSLTSFGQTNHQKVITIINKLNLIENQKAFYKPQLESLMYQATGNDSIKILELEKSLSDIKVAERISSVFDDTFSSEEINTLYDFIRTSAFEKFFSSRETLSSIYSKFQDIDKEIEEISKNIKY